MKLSIVQLAQIAGWYRNFENANGPVLRLIELGNLAFIVDSIVPDAQPRPTDLAPAQFVELVASLIPRLIEENAASLQEFGESGKKFADALASGMKALDAT